MKKLMLSLFAAGVTAVAFADAAWETGSYDVTAWSASDHNILSGLTATHNDKWYAESGKNMPKDTAVLTDRLVPGGGSTDYTKIVGIVKDMVLTWSFDDPYNLQAIKIFSRWGDGGRDGISISKVEVDYGTGDFVTLNVPPVKFGNGDNSTSGHLYAILSDGGLILARGVTGLRLTFGDQDNNGSGYVEIEAIGDLSTSLDMPAGIEEIVDSMYLSVGGIGQKGCNAVVDAGNLVGGASPYDLTYQFATDSEFSAGLIECPVLTAQATAINTAVPLSGLSFSTDYYVRAKLTSGATTLYSSSLQIKTLDPFPSMTTFRLEKGGSTFASFFWSLAEIGGGSSYASVAIEWDTSDDFSDPASQVISSRLEEPTTPARVVVRDLAASQKYYFRLKTENECGVIAYSDPIEVNTTATEVNRIWANAGTDMNDPASYLENLLPGDGDTIYFTEPVKVQPYLTSSLTVKGVFFGLYDGSRTAAEDDPTGYVITGAEGAVLTLTGQDGNSYAVNSATTAGEAEINVPLLLTGNSPHLAANGMRINLSGAISTSGEYTQDVQTLTGGENETHIGYLIFSTANPDFKPSMIHWSTGRMVYAHPQALMNVKTIASGNWGGYLPYVYNTSGEPMVMDKMESFARESHGHNGLTFEGSPFIMTNCEFSVSRRDNKFMTFNAMVAFKSVGGWDYSGNAFSKGGTNMLEMVGDYHESENITSHLHIARGLFYPHKLLETVARTDRRCRLNGDGANDTAQPYPTLGVDKDVRIPVSNLGGISFGKDSEVKGGGLSGMGGEVKVMLTDKSDNPLTLEYGVKTPEGSGYLLPNPFAFGHFAATGTVILENDITRSGGDINMCAFQGKANVAGRYAGHLTVSGGNFAKNGNGTLAFEGSLTLDSGKQVQANGGGLLINTDLSEIVGDIRLNNDAWIGGTGVVAHIWKESASAYGAIRPGEFGKGTLMVKGTKNSKFADKTGFIVDITATGTTGLLKLEGSSIYDMNRSGYWMRIEPQEGAPAGKYKIMDWSGMDGTPSGNWISANGFTVQYDARKVKKAVLSVEDNAMYLTYAPVAPVGLKLILR